MVNRMFVVELCSTLGDVTISPDIRLLRLLTLEKVGDSSPSVTILRVLQILQIRKRRRSWFGRRASAAVEQK